MLTKANEQANNGAKNLLAISRRGNWLDWMGTSLATIAVILSVIYYINNPKCTMLLIGLVGTVLGWACGLIITPYDADDSKQMGVITKVISGVVGGYFVAKLDRILDVFLISKIKIDTNDGDSTEMLASHAAVCFIMFTTIFIFVYVTRTYNLNFSVNKELFFLWKYLRRIRRLRSRTKAR